MRCESCTWWRRYKHHPELTVQHEWGDCRLLTGDRHEAERDERIIIYGTDRDGNYINPDVETHYSFACALWDWNQTTKDE